MTKRSGRLVLAPALVLAQVLVIAEATARSAYLSHRLAVHEMSVPRVTVDVPWMNWTSQAILQSMLSDAQMHRCKQSRRQASGGGVLIEKSGKNQ